MRQHGVVPEFEIFDAGMLATLARWLHKGVVLGTGACRLRAGRTRRHARHARRR
jgi:hypothetical protein